MIDLENRTLKMEGVFEHKTTFSFDELQKGMFDGWREENDPSESWMTDPDSEEEEKLSARKGLAAGMGSKDVYQDEREKKRRRLNSGVEEKGSRASSRTRAWLKLIWEIRAYCTGRRLGAGREGETGAESRLERTEIGTRTGRICTYIGPK
jgi:hypothetical protein